MVGGRSLSLVVGCGVSRIHCICLVWFCLSGFGLDGFCSCGGGGDCGGVGGAASKHDETKSKILLFG